MLNFLFWKVIAQDLESVQASVTSSLSAATTSFVSLTPAMSSSSVSSYFAALATSAPQQPGDSPSAGDASSTAGAGDSDAGASGSDSGSITISKGGIIAIIVCVTFVVVFGSKYIYNLEGYKHLLTSNSCFICTLVPCQEAVMGSSQDD